jgi:hypothetical protein
MHHSGLAVSTSHPIMAEDTQPDSSVELSEVSERQRIQSDGGKSIKAFAKPF